MRTSSAQRPARTVAPGADTVKRRGRPLIHAPRSADLLTVSSEPRVKRLRELLQQIERLPPSAERERMLREVRGRLVDVDTGVTTRGMMPVDAESRPVVGPSPAAARRPKPGRRPPAAPRPEPSDPGDFGSLAEHGLLSLGDPAPPPPPRPADRPRPWARGLRG